MNPIISFVYYIGIFSCAMQGAEKGKYDHCPPIHRYILNCFGGGLMRDCILVIYPWLFTKEALTDLIFAILVGCIYSFFIHKLQKKYMKFVNIFVLFTDALGLGSFISKGINRASIYTDNMIIIILCGYITAIGGGILASEQPLAKIFQNSKTFFYHTLTILCCCMYYLTKSDVSLIIVTTISISLINLNILDVCYLIFFLIIVYKPYVKVLIQYQNEFYYNTRIHKNRTKKIYSKKYLPLILPKRYLVFRRIRQC